MTNWSGLSDPNSNLRFHAFLLGVAALNAYFGNFLMSVPLIAWVLARWILMGASRLKHHAEEAALGDWNGRYFAFDGRQVRVHWDATAIWVDVEDLMRAAGRQPDQATLGRIRLRIGAADCQVPSGTDRLCFSDQGAVAYLDGLSDMAAQKVHRWLTREVLPNIVRLRERQSDAFRRFRVDGGESGGDGRA
ncbi:MAG: hypothetical protein H6R14_629 [Proteobacteria bacterium]|nr:hypothetical protein [Pseudomonadota bacterium]